MPAVLLTGVGVSPLVVVGATVGLVEVVFGTTALGAALAGLAAMPLVAPVSAGIATVDDSSAPEGGATSPPDDSKLDLRRLFSAACRSAGSWPMMSCIKATLGDDENFGERSAAKDKPLDWTSLAAENP